MKLTAIGSLSKSLTERRKITGKPLNGCDSFNALNRKASVNANFTTQTGDLVQYLFHNKVQYLVFFMRIIGQALII
ncbi:CLUMA_CG014789, isoform A [Clunio marinus]|uniref:CLUMA_CG014789, isoform A n=1 Tax=Clunio marinus TaxID=568069 RepID=A0A1J1IKZ3_9DIPT|nr:CLUMA_CG014789, isoform A [Clunio marinus]